MQVKVYHHVYISTLSRQSFAQKYPGLVVYFEQCAVFCASLFLCLSSSYSGRKDRGWCGAGACYIGIIIFIIVTIINIVIIILLEIVSIGGSSPGKVTANLYIYWTSQELHLKKYEIIALTAITID